MAASIEQVNMIEGALLPKVLRFSLPLAATGVLQLLFNAADVIVVGKFAGATALAAVGATTALINLLVNAFMGISVGVNILVARYLGCREDERVRACVHTAFALSLLLGLVVMAAGLTLSTPMLELMKTPKDVLPLSSLYLRIYFLGIPGTIMYNFGAALLRAFGDTKRPMLFLTVSGIVNASLNLFFVSVCGANVLIQSSVNSFGASVVAANTAAASIEGFVYTAMNSVFHAAITFTSQNLGAGKIDRIKKVLTACLTTVLMIGLPLNLICYLFGPNSLSIYVSSADSTYKHVIHYGVIRLHRIGCIYFLCGIMEVMCGMVRGLGKSWLPMFVTGVGACLSRIIWIYTIFQVHHTPEVLYSSYPMSWILTLSMHAVCFFVIYRQYERKLAGNTPAAT